MEEINKFEAIRSVIRKGPTIATRDSKSFSDYEKGKISLEQCLSNFIANNRIGLSKSKNITLELFKDWLSSLGYSAKEQ